MQASGEFKYFSIWFAVHGVNSLFFYPTFMLCCFYFNSTIFFLAHFSPHFYFHFICLMTLHSVRLVFFPNPTLSLSLCNNKKFGDLMGNDVKNTITSQHQLSKATFTIKLIDFNLNQWLWKHFKMNVNYNRPSHMIHHIPKDALTILTFFNLP